MSLFKNEPQNASENENRDPRPLAPSERIEKPRRKSRAESGTISVFGAGIVVEGEVRAQGDVQIEGRVTGNLLVDGQVSVAAPGMVEGDLTADRVVVAGKVDGSIEARDSARLVSGAQVDADISCPRLELEEGATLNGSIDMGKKGSSSRSDRLAQQAPKSGKEAAEEAKREVA